MLFRSKLAPKAGLAPAVQALHGPQNLAEPELFKRAIGLNGPHDGVKNDAQAACAHLSAFAQRLAGQTALLAALDELQP